MKNRKASDEARNSLREVFNALVPPVEELDDEDVANILACAGIDPEALTAKAHQRLQDLAGRRYLSQGENVPPELKNALQQLKPADLADRVNLATSKARAAIRSIFEKVKEKTVAPVQPVLGHAAPQPSFRNKKDLTDADREQLAELQEELDKNDAASKEGHRDSE
jgi:hypothetical protein